MKIIKNFILKTIKLYQKIFSPDQGIFKLFFFQKTCCFYPSCSEYTYQSIQKHGVAVGCWKGIKRILRCHPWRLGGVDLP